MAAHGAREGVYWGEIHGHSEMSDGVGEFGYMLRHARDVGCLDFAAGADHACQYCDHRWRRMQDVVNRHDDPGRFTTPVGYEWAGAQGHRNVYTSGERLALYRGMYAPTGGIASAEAMQHGDVAHAEPGGGLDARVRWEDEGAPDGRHWYYLRVTQGGGERAWTSPVWVEVA